MKRRPYKKYINAKWKWIDVFNKIDLIKHQKIKKTNIYKLISKEYGILYKTLVNKYNKYQNDRSNIDKKCRGGSNKIFTNKEEQLIFDYLKNNYIDKNEFLCDEIIKIYAIQQNELWHPHKKFLGSNGWCYNFKIRWNLSTVKCSKSRKATKQYTNKELDEFIDNCTNQYKKVGPTNFFNIDETNIYHINAPSTTIHIKNSKDAKININGNTKEGISTILMINANNDMLKPILIAKEKQKRCLSKYNLDDKQIRGTFSNNGWSNIGIIKILIDEIYIKTKGEKSCLLMDQYSSHTNEVILEYASNKNIKIIFIPVGYTSKFQPLDVTINGILKKKLKAIWRKEKIKNINLKISYKDANTY